MANPRFQSNGVDVLLDAILKAGHEPGAIREHMWQVAWGRGYQEISVPLPMPETKVEGHIMLADAVNDSLSLVLIDDGERLLGVVDNLGEPPVGARVRMIPNFGEAKGWSLKVLATLGCGLQLRFDDASHADTTWIDRLRHCLSTIREEERINRKHLESQRGGAQFVTPPKPFRAEMENADKEIRERVLSGGYTEEEKRQFERAKSPDAVAKLVAIRNKRLVDAYRAEVMEFRQKIPALREAYDAEMEKYAAYRQTVDQINAADAASRSVTDTTLRSTQLLDTIEAAALNVRAVDLGRVEEHPRAAFHELTQTIDLLYELVPKRIQQSRAAASANT